MKSIRFKLTSICLILLAIPSLVVGIMGYQSSKNELDKSGRVELQHDVQLTIGMMDVLNQQVEAGKLKLSDAEEIVAEQILGKKSPDGKRPIKMRIGTSGYILAIDYQGKEIMHPTVEGTNIWDTKSSDGIPMGKTFVETAQKGGGFVTYSYGLPNNPKQTAMKITYVQAYPNWNLVVCAGSYMQDFNSGSNQILYALLITLAVALILGAIITYLFARRLVNPIVQMVKQAELVANGDLTGEPLQIKRMDELGKLAQSFNAMLSSLKSLISNVTISSEQVASSSEQLSASAEQTSRATEHIATSMQELAVGSDNQARGAEEGTKMISSIHKNIVQISENTKQVSKSAVKTNEFTHSGNQAIQNTIDQMSTINEKVNQSSNIVTRLAETTNNIGEIVEVITGIASQTNLLALNAAIEAARAGEQGRGFAVVADEVRKLAEQSAQSAGQIGELIRSIQEETEKAMSAMKESIQAVESGKSVVKTAEISFAEIEESINNVTDQIGKITEDINLINEATEGVVNKIIAIDEVTKEGAISIQNVSAAAQEQLASMEEINAASNSLSKMALELQDVVSKFKW